VFGVGTWDFCLLFAAKVEKLAMADDALSESFHDTNQTILSPEATPLSAPVTAPQGNTSGDSSTDKLQHNIRVSRHQTPFPEMTPAFLSS
jgi:hypothetical protein